MDYVPQYTTLLHLETLQKGHGNARHRRRSASHPLRSVNGRGAFFAKHRKERRAKSERGRERTNRTTIRMTRRKSRKKRVHTLITSHSVFQQRVSLSRSFSLFPNELSQSKVTQSHCLSVYLPSPSLSLSIPSLSPSLTRKSGAQV